MQHQASGLTSCGISGVRHASLASSSRTLHAACAASSLPRTRCVMPFAKSTLCYAARRRCRLHRSRCALRVQAKLPFEVVQPAKAAGGYELRLYRPRFVVEMPYTNRQEAYEAFDRYLTGGNRDGFGLDAPPPVVMRHDPTSGKIMQMLALKLGSAVDDATLLQQPPLPNDSRLALNIAGGEVVASLQFTGQATKQASESAYARLKEQLSQDGISLADAEANGLYRVVQYSPVHSLQAKTNELWLAVQLND